MKYPTLPTLDNCFRTQTNPREGHLEPYDL